MNVQIAGVGKEQTNRLSVLYTYFYFEYKRLQMYVILV